MGTQCIRDAPGIRFQNRDRSGICWNGEKIAIRRPTGTGNPAAAQIDFMLCGYGQHDRGCIICEIVGAVYDRALFVGYPMRAVYLLRLRAVA
jgi:hypothetical protein